MRNIVGFAACAAVALVPAVASAQSAYGRIAPPQAVEGWTPTAPQVATSRTSDPWQQYAPLPAAGINAGQFKVYPSVTAGAFYDDNVFASPNNRQGSWGGLVRPELGLTTSGQTYALEARGFVEDRWYSRFSTEDQINGAAGLAGVAMLDNDTQVVGRARYVHAHEDRGVGESELASFDKPVAYDTFEAAGAINKRFNRWWTSVGGAVSWQHYQDPTITGVSIDQSYRNGNVGVVTGRLGYVVAPLTSVFVEVAGNQRNFQVDAFDSRGWRAVGGVLLEPGPNARVKGEAYAGYMFQDYNGASFQTVSTFTYGGALAFLLAPRWTANVYGSRVALESGLVNNGVMGVSLIESTVAGRIDYQVMPNLFVGAGASYIADEFLGAGRTDRAISPLASVKYFVNPYVTLGFDYRNVSFDSSGVGVPSYYRNVYLFSVNARL